MADTLHSALTGSDLHESKGADAASLGQVAVATGSGTAVFASLNYSYLTGKPVIPTVQYGGTTLTSTPIVGHYQVAASAGAFSQDLSGFTTIHSFSAFVVSPAADSTPVDVIVTSVGTTAIAGQIVDFAGTLQSSNTSTVYITVYGV